MEQAALFAGLALLALAYIAFRVVSRKRRAAQFEQRARFIEKYAFPAELRNQLQREDELTLEKSGLVIEGLRQYFLACLAARRRRSRTPVGMPSMAVDSAWHAFILMTREYRHRLSLPPGPALQTRRTRCKGFVVGRRNFV